MIVDFLLRLLGENPRTIANHEKWVSVLVNIFSISPVFVAAVLGTLPWLWLGWYKRKHRKISRRVYWKAFLLSVALFFAGFYVLDVIAEIIAGIGLRQLYGG